MDGGRTSILKEYAGYHEMRRAHASVYTQVYVCAESRVLYTKYYSVWSQKEHCTQQKDNRNTDKEENGGEKKKKRDRRTEAQLKGHGWILSSPCYILTRYQPR